MTDREAIISVVIGVFLMIAFGAGVVGIGIVLRPPSDYSNGVVPVVQPLASSGSGFVIAKTADYYYVATAQHVVDNPQAAVVVDGWVADIVAVDLDRDLAILRIPRAGQRYRIFSLTDAKWRESATAFGYHWANGIPCPELVALSGQVGCLNFGGQITFDGGLFPGLSGGPLVNSKGRVIGVAARLPGAWGHPFESMACFVPSRYVKELLGSISNGS